MCFISHQQDHCVCVCVCLLPAHRSTFTGSAGKHTPLSGLPTCCRCWRERWRREEWGISSLTNSTWPAGIKAMWVCESVTEQSPDKQCDLRAHLFFSPFTFEHRRLMPVFTLTRKQTWSLASNRKLIMADPCGIRSSKKSAKKTLRKEKHSFQIL